MWHWSVLHTNTVMIKAKFQNLQDLNSRTFPGFSSRPYFQAPYLFSSTFKGLEVLNSKFKHFQGFLKHAMNSVVCSCHTETSLQNTLKQLIISSAACFAIWTRSLTTTHRVVGIHFQGYFGPRSATPCHSSPRQWSRRVALEMRTTGSDITNQGRHLSS